MPRVLVVYDSATGNTEKMAKAVVKGVNEVRGIVVSIKRAGDTKMSDLTAADGIIFGSPTYYGDMSARLKALFDKSNQIHGKLQGKVGGAFTSSGDTACGAETTLLSITHAMLIHGMIVQGRNEDKHYGPTAVEAPNEKEIKLCKDLGKRVASLVVKLSR